MKYISVIAFIALLLNSCSTEPQPIEFGKDRCAFCKMTMMDKKFGAELINAKGKALKFDSGECMIQYLKTDKTFKAEKHLIINYENPGELIDATSAIYLHGGEVNSPMGGNLAAFRSKKTAEPFQQELRGELINWNELVGLNF